MDNIARLFRKIRIIIHRIFNFWIYLHGNKVKLYGIPKFIYGSKVHFGRMNRVNDGVVFHAKNHIYLGDNVTFSFGVSIITESYDTSSYDTYVSKKHLGASVHIGNNVWLGANSIVLPGVTIADDIIVGAGSVVTHDLLEEKSIYAGNPAKKIKRIGE